MRKSLAMALLVPLLGACEGATGPEGEATVAVRFGTTGGSRSVAYGGPSLAQSAQQELRIQGSNGTLVITDIRLIVAELELKRADDSCDEECEFEAAPFLLQVPLTSTSTVEVARDRIPLGTYSELEFEVEDLDEDADDEPSTQQGIATIRQQIAAAFPGVSVPRAVSMFVQGRFIPTSGPERPFLTLFDAEIEVELDLVPALTISDAGASRTVTVNLDPSLWFVSGGQVRDLSAFDFLRTGRLLEFEAEIEKGFRVEVDD